MRNVTPSSAELPEQAESFTPLTVNTLEEVSNDNHLINEGSNVLFEQIDNAAIELIRDATSAGASSYQEMVDTIQGSNEVEDKPKDKSEEILAPNPSYITEDLTTSRFNLADWFKAISEEKVLLAGIGGIGSFTGFLLSRTNVGEITLVDPDTVEYANLSGQLYSKRDVGCLKISALTDFLRLFSNYYSTIVDSHRITSSSTLRQDIHVVICGFDNMEARKNLFNTWLKAIDPGKKKLYLFIDGRLAAEEFQVLCIRGNDEYNINRYKNEFLFSDEEAEATVCSYKQTSFCSNMIASVMVNLLVNFEANKYNPEFERPIPFYTSYDAVTMIFRKEN